MDSANLIAAGTFAYLVGSFALHRMRLSRTQRDGLELSLLRRIDRAHLPSEADPALEAYGRAEAARVQGDAAAREKEAHAALGYVKHAGGAKASAALAYLDATIRLAHLVGPVNVELVGISSILALKAALKKFGSSPELHLGLAHAHAVLGQTTSSLDELGRAVYYAHGAPFYVDLVLASEFVERMRPRLRQQCLDEAKGATSAQNSAVEPS
ncbi:MAG: hypothetical protein JST54_04020 [Deltaproteobacteria bacterium]|nr:hypothetical protein [Deltaproteobacteria bacterium]